MYVHIVYHIPCIFASALQTNHMGSVSDLHIFQQLKDFLKLVGVNQMMRMMGMTSAVPQELLLLC